MLTTMIVPVYQSWEVVRRQLLYWDGLDIPKEFHIITFDDGSSPPININREVFPYKFRHIRYDINYPWRQGERINEIVKQLPEAIDNILIMPIDHMITNEIIKFSIDFSDDKLVHFPREKAVLCTTGRLCQDFECLILHGMEENCDTSKKILLPIDPSVDIYLLRRSTYIENGGYRGGVGVGADVILFNKLLESLEMSYGPKLYCWPFESSRGSIFHNLPRTWGKRQ